MRADLRKRKPSRLRKRRIIRSMECPDEDEDEAMIGGPEPNKPPATVQGKKVDE